MLQFILCLMTFTVQAQQRLMLPMEILSVLQKEYPADQPLKPVLDEVAITIKGEKNSQEVRVGITENTLDLAAYVDKDEPSFEVTIKPSYEPNDRTKVLFINRYRPLQSKKKSLGMACGKAVKIQKHLDKLFTTQGVKFMTKDAAYLNLLGGDFLVTHVKDQVLHVSYFKIVDGRYSSRLCN